MKKPLIRRAALGCALCLVTGLTTLAYAGGTPDPAAVTAAQSAVDNATQRKAAVEAALPDAMAGAGRAEQNNALRLMRSADKHLARAEKEAAEDPESSQRQSNQVHRALERIQKQLGIELGGEG